MPLWPYLVEPALVKLLVLHAMVWYCDPVPYYFLVSVSNAVGRGSGAAEMAILEISIPGIRWILGLFFSS